MWLATMEVSIARLKMSHVTGETVLVNSVRQNLDDDLVARGAVSTAPLNACSRTLCIGSGATWLSYAAFLGPPWPTASIPESELALRRLDPLSNSTERWLSYRRKHQHQHHGGCCRCRESDESRAETDRRTTARTYRPGGSITFETAVADSA
jgi:hypothetical protein